MPSLRPVVAVLAGLLALPAGAQANTLTKVVPSGADVTVTTEAVPGSVDGVDDAHQITVSQGASGELVLDAISPTGSGLTAAAPCIVVSTTRATCPADASNTRKLTISAGAGNDTVTLQLADRNAAGVVAIDVAGGPGNDLLRGGPMAETLRGDHRTGTGQPFPTSNGSQATFGPQNDREGDDDIVLGGGGADTIFGNGADDYLSGNGVTGATDTGGNVLDGGPGTDLLAAGDTPGADTLRGGSLDQTTVGPSGGTASIGLPGGGEQSIQGDTVSYRTRSFPAAGPGVTADIDGAADDGVTGENDTIATDVESLEGSVRDDRLTGSSAANLLIGLGGSDTLDGAGAADRYDLVDGVRDACPVVGSGDAFQLDLVDPTVASCTPASKPKLLIAIPLAFSTPADETVPPVLLSTPRATRTGARAKVTCPRTATRVCRGTLRVSVRPFRVVAGRTAFALKPGASRTVTVSAPATRNASLVQIAAVIRGTSKKGPTTTFAYVRR